MKDLRALDTNEVGQLIVQLLIGEPGLSEAFRGYRKVYIRLLKKALYEYEMTRITIIEWISDKRDLMKPYKYANHMETCINAVIRIYRLLGKMEADNGTPKLPTANIEALDELYHVISKMRNAIEHIDGNIQQAKIT